MSKKLTTEQFIEKARLKHGNKYDYSVAKYVNAKTKIKIICSIHGVFEQTSSTHYKSGCPKCYGTPKKTKKEFVKNAVKVHGHIFDYSLVDYKDNKTKVKIICPIHGIFEQNPHTHLRGSGCPICGGTHSLNQEYFIGKFNNIHENKYDYSLVDYKNSKTKVKIICPIHGIFEQNPRTHLRGSGCPECALVGKIPSNTEQFIEKAKLKHRDKYDYSLVDYKNSRTKIKIICSIHGVFKQNPSTHLGGSGCYKCSPSAHKNTSIFIKEANLIHSDKYNYKLVNYKNIKRKVKIICKEHGVFEQDPDSHLKGSGCPKCAGKNLSQKERIIILNSIHDNLYDYSKMIYTKADNEIKVICPIHGVFSQKYSSHLGGSGCPKCKGYYKTTNDIIKEFSKVHNNRYDYKLVNYDKANKKMKIICKKHGVFSITASNHLQGKGCHKCGKSISKAEQSLASWIKDNIFMRKIKTNKRFYYSNENKNKYYELDIYIPSLNIGIEFNGLEFHHTHGKNYQGNNKFHKDKYYHRDKSRFFQDNYGIRIIHIWEHEWLEKPEIIKNILKMQLGIKRERIYARKCELRKITNKEAKPLLDSSHLQGHVNSTLNYGLFHNNELVSVMGFGKSTQGKDAKWELRRFSNKLGVVVIGGAEKLLKAFDKEHNYPSLKSFSMNRIFSGKLYEQLGFKLIKILHPTYFYHKRYEIVLRRNAQKKNIHSFIPAYTYTKNKTEVQTMNENGYFQIFDTGMNYWLRK